MSLLELLSEVSATETNAAFQSEFPVILNPDSSLLNLKPEGGESHLASLISPFSGWEFSKSDTQVTRLGKKLCTKLRRRLKDMNRFNKDEFIDILNQFLVKIMKKIGISVGLDSNDTVHPQSIVEKIGPFLGRDLIDVVLEASLRFDAWDLVEVIIVNGFLDRSHYHSLVVSLVDKNKPDMICLVIKHAHDLDFPELCCILKYLLGKHTYSSMEIVRMEWEKQASLAIEMACDKNLQTMKSHSAKNTSILLMLALDGFLPYELCLHYVLASSNFDDVILSSAIHKLDGEEMMRLMKYLGKWLKKYEMYPHIIHNSSASSLLGLKICDWVPKLENIVRFLGSMIDESFSFLVLNPQFHEELRSIEALVASLLSKAMVSYSIADVVRDVMNRTKNRKV